MPSDLTPAEREDREADRLINKKRAPSRKRAPKRGPKHDNRRRRVRDHDSDAESNRPAAPPRSASFHVGAVTEADLIRLVGDHRADLANGSEKVAAEFDKFSDDQLLSGHLEAGTISRWVQSDRAQLQKARRTPVSGDMDRAIDSLVAAWPQKRTDFGKRSGIIESVRDALDKAGSGLPSTFTAPFRKSDLPPLEKKKLVEEVLQSSGKSLSAEDLDGADFVRFGGLAALLRVLETNPVRLSKALLVPEVARLMEVVHGQAEQIISLDAFGKAWDKAVEDGYLSQDGEVDEEEPDVDSYFDSVLQKLDSALNRKDPVVPDGVVTDAIRDSLKKKYGRIPAPLEGLLSGRAASYGRPGRKPMAHKTAAYHGVLDQSHPERASFGKATVEKRDLGKDHYDSIVASAEGFLKGAWLKEGWDPGTDDAPMRAALDLAIHTADDAAYQSKIDAETYDMLLNRLAGWGHDQFEDTILPQKARSASMSNQHVQTILRVASDLRQIAPDASLELVRSIRSLVATEAESLDMTAGDKPMDDLKKQTKKLMDSKDIGEFVEGMGDLSDSMKTAGARTASEDVHLALTDLPEEDAAAFHQSGLETAQTMLAALDGGDLTAFCAAADQLVESAEQAVESARVSTARVKISTLVRLAHLVPGARDALLPVILAASKKKPAKKKPAKTSKGKKEDEKPEPKDGKKPNPFAKKDGEKPSKKDEKGGKKPNPFGGKKAPPFGKKKAHVAMSESDADWG